MTLAVIFLIAVLVVLVILVGMYFSYNNREVALRKEAEAQNQKITAVHDTMWKVLKQKANVTEQYKETFEKIYPELIEGRYSKDSGNAMKWIQEANPDFDTSLLQDLMQAVEVQRTHFMNSQTRMLDIIREREALIESYPSKWFVSNKSKIEYTVIAASKTNDVIATRIDDDIDLFNK